MAETSMLAHVVLFTLDDNSDQARQQLLAECKRRLSHHPGTVFYAAGTRADDIHWPVSDRDFDVAVCLVFKDRAAHDAYLDSADHTTFLEENERRWSSLRVLDAYVGQ